MLKNLTSPITLKEDNETKNCIKIFILTLILANLVFLPFIIYNKGIFLLYGDYNGQQIPFYRLAHDAIRNKEFGINWHTDLGSNFIASYSFYLFGSPFFWLTIPLPSECLPYIMAPLLTLKISVAALTSYIFIRKFTKTHKAAFVGALLYAFSGYSIYNIFYNHFHEIIAFFPLILIGFEELIINKKKGFFAIAIAINLIINFYFFVPEMVFLLIYFLFRCFASNFKVNFKIILSLAAELTIGVLIGMFIFIPSALMVLKNPRVSGTLLGFDMILYGDVQRYGLLLHSLFFPPDMPSVPNYFPFANAKWNSVAAYMPMFGMTGVLAFFKQNKDSWLKKLLKALLIMAFIPILNSAFNGFNSSYYARWFFALTIVLATITAISIEQNKKDFKYAAKINIIVLLCFATIGLIPDKINDKIQFFGLPKNKIVFWLSFIFAIVGILLTILTTREKCDILNKKNKSFIIVFSFFIVTYSMFELAGSKFQFEDAYKSTITQGMNCKLNLNDPEFYRIDYFPESLPSNLGMMWKEKSVRSFQSTVNSSIINFYNNLNIKRDVDSKIPPGIYNNLRNFLSVKYIAIEENNIKEYEKKLPKNYSFLKKENSFNIYINNDFINMGFILDRYIDEERFNKLNGSAKEKVILKAAVLSNDQIKKYEDILTPISDEEIENLKEENMQPIIDNLKENCCYEFKENSYGFNAKINAKKDGLIVFSVPFEEGFKATSNEKETDVEKIDYGVMAIKCKKGKNNIIFSYETPGLLVGGLISISGLLALIIYLIINKKIKRKINLNSIKNIT